MSSYVTARISIPQNDLLIAFNPDLMFNCNICKKTGKQQGCFCHKCKRFMHPSCAGVEIGTVYDANGTKQVVLPGPEKLPKSCCECLREMVHRGGRRIFAGGGQESDSYSLSGSNPLANRSDSLSDIFFQSNDEFLGPTIQHAFQAQKYREGQENFQRGAESQLDLNFPRKYQMDGIGLMNQVFPQQRYPAQPYSGSSITSVIEWGKPHKIEEGHDDCMVHTYNPGHNIWPKDNGNYSCDGCKMDGFGCHYACGNSSCSFILHQECLLPRKTTTHSFFPKSTFLFTCSPITSYSKHGKKEHTNVFCVACGMSVKGYHYHDRNGLYNLHPCCIKLPAQIISGDSGVEMVLQKESTSKCSHCHETSVKRGKSSTDHVWSYVAKSENYHLHIGCLNKLLSDWREDSSMGRLISCKMTSKKGVARMNLEIALRRAKTTCKSKFKIFVKYAKIALGAIIAALLGDATTLFVNTAVALSSE